MQGAVAQFTGQGNFHHGPAAIDGKFAAALAQDPAPFPHGPDRDAAGCAALRPQHRRLQTLTGQNGG